MTSALAVKYGFKASTVLEVDFDPSKKVIGMAFLHSLVLVDVHHPLFPGCYLICSNKPKVWVQFRYERISDWCHGCGHLDHTQHFCSFATSLVEGSKESFLNFKATVLDSKRFAKSFSTPTSPSFVSSHLPSLLQSAEAQAPWEGPNGRLQASPLSVVILGGFGLVPFASKSELVGENALQSRKQMMTGLTTVLTTPQDIDYVGPGQPLSLKVSGPTVLPKMSFLISSSLQTSLYVPLCQMLQHGRNISALLSFPQNFEV